MLVKAAIYEKTHTIIRSPLGSAIKKFELYYPDQKQLISWLNRYNKFLYVDAKHDFTLPSGRREHRFTSREVVLAAFVTMELSKRLTRISRVAKRVNNDEPMD